MVNALLETDTNGKGSLVVVRFDKVAHSDQFYDDVVRLQKELHLENSFHIIQVRPRNMFKVFSSVPQNN